MRIAVFCSVLLVPWSLARAGEVSPPEVLSRVDAAVPTEGAPPTRDHVLLELTVGIDGAPSNIVVVESAGDAWDRASIRALQQWRFVPAKEDGGAVPARTRLSFAMPMVASAPLDGGQAVDGEAVDAGHPPHELATTVLGRALPKSRGAGDYALEVGELKQVPRGSATEFLKLAPGLLLTNEGGEGHPEHIFLRGFDAREGQDLELTVDGVPINDSGNLHGNGYADLHFLIPELVENLRVLEGPFDPRQGNFAVAGSADYQLGLSERGIIAKGTFGSFDTQRLLLLWGPPGETERTFGGVELFKTAGFGQNRAAQNARAIAQYEGRLSDATRVRLGATAYGGTFQSAGLLRVDDVDSGLKNFYDTYDARQGGDSVRAQVHGEVEGQGAAFRWNQALFGIYRLTRVRENFTGFLEDVQLPQQSLHEQRGDLIDRTSRSVTVGARGSARTRLTLFNRTQELEVGYLGRVDVVSGLQQRVQAGGNVPYRREFDLDSTLTDLGAYADLNVSPVWWLTVRGGLRAEVLTYDVLDRCAVQTVRRPDASNPPGDASCLSQQDFGRYREPDERNSTTAAVLLPRASVLVGPFQGLTVSGSIGTGVRSIDPQYISQNLEAPFASIFSYEGGLTWAHRFEQHDTTARAVVFGTRVDKDVVFNEQAGRGVIGGSTSRLGALLSGRARGAFYDVSANLTWVQSKFDDTNLLVPYVPDLVGRLDAAVFHQVPWWRPLDAPLLARAGLGLTYVGRRALPFGERSDVIFVIDASAQLEWKWVKLGLAVTNLLDTRYRLGEFNFASDFRTSGSLPTLVPARMFSAGPPRAVSVTLGLHFGGES